MLLKLEGDGPLYTRVFAALRQCIADGRFRPGERLPGTRSMAAALGVSRTVVLAAYAQLESEGYTTTRVGSGTFVSRMGAVDTPSAAVAMPAAPRRLSAVPLSRLAARVGRAADGEDLPQPVDAVEIIDLTDAAAMIDATGLKAWRQALSQSSGRLPDERPGAAGAAALRRGMLDYLHRERGVVADVEDVIVVNSVQQARDLIARVLVDEHTVVGVEDPCDPGMRDALQAAGARIVACAVDAGGFDIEAHADALREARFVHVSSSCQVPTGATMSAERRAALLEWAYARPTYLVEDDFDCHHRHGVSVLPALQGMDRHRRVIYYMSGFGRALYPAVQMGCVIAPPELREKLHALKSLSDRDGTAWRQHAWARYMFNGDFARGVRRLSQRLARRHDGLMRALRHHLGTEIQWLGSAASGYLLAHLPRLPSPWESLLLEEALRIGLRLQSAGAWHATPQPHVALMLHYGAVPGDAMDEVARRLARAYRTTLADIHPRPACRVG